jgi:AcrR family transcriptional regulator
MPASKVSEQDVFDGMADVFQRYGYDGASLSLLSKATGLERASLYHRFPNGKEEMADTLLARIDEWFRRDVFEPLAGPGDPPVRVRRVAQRLREFYRRGTRSCVLETLSLGGSTPRIRNHLHRTFAAWLGAFVAIARESGLPHPLARRRAMEALVRIQGALVVARLLGDEGPFLRVLDELPGKLTIQ